MSTCSLSVSQTQYSDCCLLMILHRQSYCHFRAGFKNEQAGQLLWGPTTSGLPVIHEKFAKQNVLKVRWAYIT